MEMMSSQHGHAYSSKAEKQRNSKPSGGTSQVMGQHALPPSGHHGSGYHQQRQFGPNLMQQQHHMDYDPTPVVYTAHKHGQIHQYKCKNPGCNQVGVCVCVCVCVC